MKKKKKTTKIILLNRLWASAQIIILKKKKNNGSRRTNAGNDSCVFCTTARIHYSYMHTRASGDGTDYDDVDYDWRLNNLSDFFWHSKYTHTFSIRKWMMDIFVFLFLKKMKITKMENEMFFLCIFMHWARIWDHVFCYIWHTQRMFWNIWHGK